MLPNKNIPVDLKSGQNHHTGRRPLSLSDPEQTFQKKNQ